MLLAEHERHAPLLSSLSWYANRWPLRYLFRFQGDKNRYELGLNWIKAWTSTAFPSLQLSNDLDVYCSVTARVVMYHKNALIQPSASYRMNVWPQFFFWHVTVLYNYDSVASLFHRDEWNHETKKYDSSLTQKLSISLRSQGHIQELKKMSVSGKENLTRQKYPRIKKTRAHVKPITQM